MMKNEALGWDWHGRGISAPDFERVLSQLRINFLSLALSYFTSLKVLEAVGLM